MIFEGQNRIVKTAITCISVRQKILLSTSICVTPQDGYALTRPIDLLVLQKKQQSLKNKKNQAKPSQSLNFFCKSRVKLKKTN